MFKLYILAAILAIVCAAPAPEPKPGYIAAAYTSPVVAAPALAYSAAYSAPLTYPAYSAYSSYVASSPYSYYAPAYNYALL